MIQFISRIIFFILDLTTNNNTVSFKIQQIMEDMGPGWTLSAFSSPHIHWKVIKTQFSL